MTTAEQPIDLTTEKLPDGWRWATLAQVCEINPRREANLCRADLAATSFIPMAAVDERHGCIMSPEARPFVEVRKGYTFFKEGDVLFAKITPCMQNGKHAIARGLIDGLGFGSTEFHVLRPGPFVMSEWIHYFVRQPQFMQLAVDAFVGTAGQQRVPDEFLRNAAVSVPPLAEQRRIVAALSEQLAAVERARAAAEAQVEAARALPAAYLRAVFESDEARAWPVRRLGDILHLRKDVVHPRDNPTGNTSFVGLEHIESGTGVRSASLNIGLSELTGRKPRFYRNDIVYGYLRPYLNKVWIAEFDGLCSVDQYVYSVSSDADISFVAWFMRSPVYLRRAPIDTTPGQLPRIRTEEVAEVKTGLPNLPKQRQIADEIGRTFDGSKRASDVLGSQLASVEALPAALLRQAFRGQL